MILERAPNTSVDYADARGITALHGAAQWCHFGILRLLADCGADLNFAVQGCTPLCLVLEVVPFDALAPPRDPARQLITVRALLRLGAGTLPRFVPRLSNPFEITFAPKYPWAFATTCISLLHLSQLNAFYLNSLPCQRPVLLSPPPHGLIVYNMPALAAPDPVDDPKGTTPLCTACHLGLDKVAAALLDAGANIDLATLPRPRRSVMVGFTPLMYAVEANNAGVVKMLLKRGADGAKTTSRAAHVYDAGSTALDMARSRANDNPDCAETFALLRKRCCSTCGLTSPGLSAMSAGSEQHLKRCGGCPARGPRARYCGKACQRADWVLRHRGECAEARRARQAAGTEV